jgi:hypothetical protein
MKGTVIQVGDGRGFVIATREARYVVTAAHCLPNLRHTVYVGLREDKPAEQIRPQR